MKINLASESLDPSLSVCIVSRWSHHASHVLFLFSLSVLSVFPYSVIFIQKRQKTHNQNTLQGSVRFSQRHIDSMIQQHRCKVKTSSHKSSIIKKHLTAGPCIVSHRIASHRIESKSHRIVSYRIVSWQTLWYRQISYHRPKNQYNIVTQSSKCFYTSKLYFCWSLIFFFALVTALCSCSVWARQRIPENVNTILPRSQRMETGINSAT